VVETKAAKIVTSKMLKPIGRNIKPMRKLRTLDEFTEGYFRDHPEEIDDYLTEIFQDFAEDNDTGALLASLPQNAALQTISEHNAIELSRADSITFAESLQFPPELSKDAPLTRAISRYKQSHLLK
jgi:hypothetical protein